MTARPVSRICRASSPASISRSAAEATATLGDLIAADDVGIDDQVAESSSLERLRDAIDRLPGSGT